MNAIIREKRYEDCADCERVYTLGWQQTYREIVNDEFLNGLSDSEIKRTEKSQNKFKNDENKKFVLEVDNKIVGVLSIGKCRNEKYSKCGELKSIYIINGYKGYGFGKKLFIKAIEELLNLGYKDMIVSCLQENPSNEFYRHLGGQLIDNSIFVLPNQELLENVYYFSGIEKFLK